MQVKTMQTPKMLKTVLRNHQLNTAASNLESEIVATQNAKLVTNAITRATESSVAMPAFLGTNSSVAIHAIVKRRIEAKGKPAHTAQDPDCSGARQA